MHILITCIIYGIMGMFCCATSFYFRNRKTVYFVSIFFWLIEILKPGSLLRTNSIAFLCKYAIVKLNIYSGKYYVAINYLHERKTMIKSKKNTIGIVKDTICKIALKKANTNCLSLMYEPPKPKCTWYQPQDQHYLHSNKKGGN